MACPQTMFEEGLKRTHESSDKTDMRYSRCRQHQHHHCQLVQKYRQRKRRSNFASRQLCHIFPYLSHPSSARYHHSGTRTKCTPATGEHATPASTLIGRLKQTSEKYVQLRAMRCGALHLLFSIRSFELCRVQCESLGTLNRQLPPHANEDGRGH